MNDRIERVDLQAEDRTGVSAAEYLRCAAQGLAVLVVPWSLIGALRTQSWSFTLTPAGLGGGLLFGLTFAVLFAVPSALRAAGRARLSPWAFAAGVVSAVASVVAMSELPHTALVRLPVIGLDLAVLALAWLVATIGPSGRGPAAPAKAAWWESSHVATPVVVVLCTTLGDRQLSIWPEGLLPRLGLIVALVITLQIAWAAIHADPDPDPDPDPGGSGADDEGVAG